MKSKTSTKAYKAKFIARLKIDHFRYRIKKTILFSKYPIRRLNFLITPSNGLPF